MRNALVNHDGLDISKIQVNETRNINQIRNALNSLLKHLICFLKCIRHGGTPVHNLKKPVIGNHN